MYVVVLSTGRVLVCGTTNARLSVRVDVQSGVLSFMWWSLWCILFAMVAASVGHFISPHAQGSGIPELKSILSGTPTLSQCVACYLPPVACCMVSLDVDVVGDRACVQLPEFPGAAGEGCRRSECAGRWPRDWQGGVWLGVLPTFRTVLWPQPCTAWLARVRLCMSRPSLPTRCGSCPGSRTQPVLAAPRVIKTWQRQSLQV